MAEKMKKMVLPPPNQVGVVVKNLKKTMDYYSSAFGIGPFQTVDFVPAKFSVKGKLSSTRLRIGIAQWGPVELELMEIVEGDSPLNWFLKEKGEGLQHLGIIVENYDEWIGYLGKHGINVLMSAETDIEGRGHLKAAYIESDLIGGVLFEIKEWK